jgi:DNA-binding NtrC family response regulator
VNSTGNKINLLVVDDDKASAHFLASCFEGDKYKTTIASSANQAINLMKENYYPIILSDIRLGGPDGLTLIPFTKQAEKPTLIIFVTGHGSLETAVKALGEGAFEYICKTENFNDIKSDLIRIVEQAVKHISTIEQKTDKIVEAFESSSKSIIGKSPAMVQLYRMIAKAAHSKGNVLITGESGTGKELIAHAIHDNGPFSDKPFITVNCGALTETLLESELFGHVKGSFTGATNNKKGLFEEADGGIIFLDEIGDISQALQVKLLRAIQEGEIKPVGSSENLKVSVRIISATHRNLEALIKEGIFREDLYYRLKVFHITSPPLRERKEDIPDLVKYLMGRIADNSTRPLKGISEEALKILMEYSWPGNIRELENAIERAAGMSNSGVLYAEDFTNEVITKAPVKAATTNAPTSLEEMEASHISKTLEMVNFNKTKAAELLGIDRGTLYRKAAHYGISLSQNDVQENA